MKTTRIILFLGLVLGATQWLQAQVKIGERPLDIGNERLLEMERAGELFIVTDSLEIGITTSTTTNVPNTDAMMMKLYGYGLGNFYGNQSYFLGTNANGEVLEFPITLDLVTSSSTATLSLDNGTSLFTSVDLTNLDSVFSTNNQLTDSINTIRTLVNNSDANDLDTIQINELIDEITIVDNALGDQTVLRFYEDRFELIDSERDSIDFDLGPFFATDLELADTAAALRDLIFYKIDGTLDEDRTVTGASHSLTFTGIDSFNISSVNNTFTSSSNTEINSSGTTTISSTGDVSASSSTGNVDISSTTGTVDITGDSNVSITSTNSDITIDASTDSIAMIGTVRLNEYPAKPSETVFNNILGIDASGNIINVDASTILGTETDSVIYRHNGTLISERYMTMDGFNLHFVDGTDTTIIANDGRVGIGTGTFTPNSATSNVKLEVNGDILAVRVHSSSDRRFKENITPISSALDKVMAIDGVTYDFKTEEFANRNFPTTTQVGFIAQNVEEVLPEVVRTNGDGYKAVDYAKVTALLNEAIKEQQNIIDNQDHMIQSQQETLAALMDRLESMSNEMVQLKASIKDLSNQTMSEE